MIGKDALQAASRELTDIVNPTDIEQGVELLREWFREQQIDFPAFVAHGDLALDALEVEEEDRKPARAAAVYGFMLGWTLSQQQGALEVWRTGEPLKFGRPKLHWRIWNRMPWSGYQRLVREFKRNTSV